MDDNLLVELDKVAKATTEAEFLLAADRFLQSFHRALRRRGFKVDELGAWDPRRHLHVLEAVLAGDPQLHPGLAAAVRALIVSFNRAGAAMASRN